MIADALPLPPGDHRNRTRNPHAILSSVNAMPDQHLPLSVETEVKLATLAAWMGAAEVVVWFTGAGISTESGLPDFRGPDGAWTRRDRGLSLPRPSRPLAEIRPNRAHLAIVEFERLGKCHFLISQNVDDLHLQSGFPLEKLAELHGNRNRLRCHGCDRTFAVVDVVALPHRRRTRKQRHLSHECPDCGSPLVRSIVNFGDPLSPRDLSTSYHWAGRADLFLVVGSSCCVAPAAEMPELAARRGARVVVMNIGETDVDDLCDLRFDGERVGNLLPALLRQFRSLPGSAPAVT